MGMYTILKFQGIVKEKFREEFEKISEKSDWNEAKNEVIKKFAKEYKSYCIPGCMDGVPYDRRDWGERSYDKESGLWKFHCSVKSCEEVIESFLELAPYFTEKLEHCETLYEADIYSKKYELVNGKIVMVKDKFIKYGDGE